MFNLKTSLRLAAVFAVVMATIPSWHAGAQNTQCSNRPLGDSTNACANTRFVTTAIAAIPGAVPGGANTNVQFNNAGAFGGSANLTWVSPALSVGAAGTTGQVKYVSTNASLVTVQASATTASWTLTLPTSDGTAGQALLTDGAGNTSWGTGGLPSLILANAFVTCDGVTDDTAGFVALATAINTAVSAQVEFPKNATCNVWPNDGSATATPTLMTLTNIKSVVINYNGSTIRGLYTGAVSTTYMMVSGANGLRINNLSHQSDRGKDAVTGSNHVILSDGSHNVNINGTITGGVIAIGAIRTPASAEVRSYDINIDLRTVNVYYPLSWQFDGDDVTADLVSVGAGRSYFPYGVKNHNVTIDSTDNTSNDVLIACFGVDTIGSDFNDTSNINVKYTNRNTTGSGVGGAVAITNQQYGTVTATRTCKIQATIDVDINFPSVSGPFFSMQSYVFVSAGVQALGAAAHTTNVTLRGRVTGNPSGGGVLTAATAADGFGNANLVNFNLQNFTAKDSTQGVTFGVGTATRVSLLNVDVPSGTLTFDGTIPANAYTSVNGIFSGTSATQFSQLTQPAADNVYALGTTTRRWSDFRSVTATISTLGLTNALGIASGGTGDTGTAWTGYTPTLACGSGTLTSASAAGRSKSLGKTIFVTIVITITTNGTCAGSLTATLPSNAIGTNGHALAGQVSSNGAVLSTRISNADRVFIVGAGGSYAGADGFVLIVTGVYEGA